MLSTSPARATTRSGTTRTTKPDGEGAHGGRAGERPERQPLLVRTAVQDAVDEDGRRR